MQLGELLLETGEERTVPASDVEDAPATMGALQDLRL